MMLSDAIKEHPEQFLTIEEYNKIFNPKGLEMNVQNDQMVEANAIPLTPAQELLKGLISSGETPSQEEAKFFTQTDEDVGSEDEQELVNSERELACA